MKKIKEYLEDTEIGGLAIMTWIQIILISIFGSLAIQIPFMILIRMLRK